MTPVEKAVWFIEAHLGDGIDLEQVAAASGVSRHHLVRAFGAVTGHSVMRYARERRLSNAAKALGNGAADILAVALDAGYASHEAFTRAFHDVFGVPPECARSGGISQLKLMEPIRMSDVAMPTLPDPRFTSGKLLLVAGLSQRYTDATMAQVPAQWQRFGAWIGNISGEVTGATYGVVCNGDDEGNVNYISGVEVSNFSSIPPEFAHVRIPPRHYAVFPIAEHISAIRAAWKAIWTKWLPQSGHELADAPFFERYGESFDPVSGAGGFEIWLPLKH